MNEKKSMPDTLFENWWSSMEANICAGSQLGRLGWASREVALQTKQIARWAWDAALDTVGARE
jgi:hypothetical protein